MMKPSNGVIRLWAAILLGFTGTSSAMRAADGPETEIKIGTVHSQLKYDVEQFQVKPGARVRLTFSNTDEMTHNLLILAPSSEDANVMKVAQAAWALGPAAIEKQFVPDLPEVLFHTRVVNSGASETITFTAPQKEGKYPYVCTLPGHAFTMRGVMVVSKTEQALAAKPPVKSDPPPSADPHAAMIHEPKVIRAFVEGGPPRSIAVALPGGVNFLFDADTCYVRYGWFGLFLDTAPNVVSRGGGWCKILGKKFELGDSGFPISIGERDKQQTVKFAGYRMRGREVPQFFFTVDGNRVTQTIEAATGGVGLRYEFEFERDPGAAYFYVSPNDLHLTASAGKWSSGRLELAPGEAKKFSVTILRKDTMTKTATTTEAP